MNALAGVAGQKSQCARRASKVVGHSSLGGAIAQGIGHACVLRGAAGLGDGKGQGACGFIDGDIVDRKAGAIVVLDGGGVRVRPVIPVDAAVVVNGGIGIGRCAHALGARASVGVKQRGCCKAGRELECLRPFIGGVVSGRHTHQEGRFACAQGHLIARHSRPGRAAVLAPLVRRAVVICASSRDVAQRQVDGACCGKCIGQVNRKGGSRSLLHAHARDCQRRPVVVSN